MSDSLPETFFSGLMRVVKLTSGEELIGLVDQVTDKNINIKYPARLDNYMARDANGQIIEYVKLSNYLINLKGKEIKLPTQIVVYVGEPASDLEKMYEIYFNTIQTDPKAITGSVPEGYTDPENGLQLLNDLFNNEEFVNFVNNLIENFEGVEIVMDDEEDGELFSQDDITDDAEAKEAPKPPKPKKRSSMKPEKKSLPYNPDSDPAKPESWPDDPSEYLN